jgi:DNA polymerase I-like protein with 3'-5' exonuclease and polymerase domains
VRRYQDKDAMLALRLWMHQEDEIEKQGLHDIIAFERRVFPVLAKRAMAGIRVDALAAEEAAADLDVIIEERQEAFERQIGIQGFNVNSAPQVKSLFQPVQTESGIWISGRTGSTLGTAKSGGPSLTADVLDEMDDPIANEISEIRSLIKTRDTFLRGHILGHMQGDRVYPTINQTAGEFGGTRTGRLSYQDPAMQQIPNRNKKVAARIKKAFLPEHGQTWLSTDMNSFEVRVFAHLVSLYNDALQKIYAANPATDFHQYVADLMGIPRNATKQGEANAKQINLSMIFNSGNGAIAHKIGMPWTWAEFEVTRGREAGKTVRYRKAGQEAMNVINEYHRQVPGVKTLADRAKMISEDRGYIKTFTGRRLRCINGYKSYKQSGLLIQATSADFNKMMWMGTDEPLAQLGGSLILNTHDSFDASVDDPKAAYAAMQEVARALPSRVPLLLDLNGSGSNWWEAIRKPDK